MSMVGVLGGTNLRGEVALGECSNAWERERLIPEEGTVLMEREDGLRGEAATFLGDGMRSMLSSEDEEESSDPMWTSLYFEEDRGRAEAP